MSPSVNYVPLHLYGKHAKTQLHSTATRLEAVLQAKIIYDSVVHIQAKLMASLHLEFLCSTHMAGGGIHDLLDMYWLLVKLLHDLRFMSECIRSRLSRVRISNPTTESP